MLADRFGPERAAWVARALTPTNLAVPARAARRPSPTSAPRLRGSRTPRVRLLPDRWVATAYGGGAVLAVRRDVTSRPTWPSAPTCDADATGRRRAAGGRRGHALDGRLRQGRGGRAWPCGSPLAGRRRSTCCWSRASPTATGPPRVAAQLDAHRYTDGLAFLPRARRRTTPKRDARRTRSRTRSTSASFAANGRRPKPAAGERRGTRRVGVRAAAFERLGDAGSDEPPPRAMATALWPATWGYFLAQMIGFDGTGLTVDGHRSAPRRMPRPRPRPADRCRRCASAASRTACCPVTSLDRWQGDGGDRFGDVLVRLRDVRVPAGGRDGSRGSGARDDPGADLATCS